ncbi:MAG: FliH/SctL family protein [Candidatus Eremiobacterota bacterium]
MNNNMNNQKKIIKFTKPTSDPLVIGAGGGVKTVKKELPQQHRGQLIIGARGVVKPSEIPQPQQQKLPVESVQDRHQQVQPQIQSAPQGHDSDISPSAQVTGNQAVDPLAARTIRIEKVAEEKMARAEQMLEEASSKEKYANQQLEEAQIKGKEIVKEAQAKAKKLIEDAKQYCQQLQATSEREGFEQGKNLGVEAGKQEAGAMMQQAMTLINRILEERRKVYEQVEPQVADLALKIAEKIINTEVTLNNEIVLNLIKSNLDKIKDREEIIVRVSQDDFPYVKEHEDELRKILEGVKKFRIEADGVVDKGGCMLETNLGNLDSRIEFQLEIMKRAFEQNMKES